jgi:hypothetical protein
MSAGPIGLNGRRLNITHQNESAIVFKMNADGIANVPCSAMHAKI